MRLQDLDVYFRYNKSNLLGDETYSICDTYASTQNSPMKIVPTSYGKVRQLFSDALSVDPITYNSTHNSRTAPFNMAEIVAHDKFTTFGKTCLGTTLDDGNDDSIVYSGAPAISTVAGGSMTAVKGLDKEVVGIEFYIHNANRLLEQYGSPIQTVFHDVNNPEIRFEFGGAVKRVFTFFYGGGGELRGQIEGGKHESVNMAHFTNTGPRYFSLKKVGGSFISDVSVHLPSYLIIYTNRGTIDANIRNFRPCLGKNEVGSKRFSGVFSKFVITYSDGTKTRWEFDSIGTDRVYDISVNPDGSMENNDLILSDPDTMHTITDNTTASGITRGASKYQHNTTGDISWITYDMLSRPININLPDHTLLSEHPGGYVHNGWPAYIDASEPRRDEVYPFVYMHHDGETVRMDYEPGGINRGLSFVALDGKRISSYAYYDSEHDVVAVNWTLYVAGMHASDATSVPLDGAFFLPPTGWTNGYSFSVRENPWVLAGFKNISLETLLQLKDTNPGYVRTKTIDGLRVVTDLVTSNTLGDKNHNELTYNLHQEEFSILGTFNASEIGGRRGLFSVVHGSDDIISIGVTGSGNDRISSMFFEGRSGTTLENVHGILSGNGNVSANSDHTFMCTYDGSVWELYLDGKLDSSINEAIVLPDSQDGCMVGVIKGSGFNGTISDIGIHDSKLTLDDYLDYINNTKNTPTRLIGNSDSSVDVDGLVMGTNDGVHDLSGNNNVFEITGNTYGDMVVGRNINFHNAPTAAFKTTKVVAGAWSSGPMTATTLAFTVFTSVSGFGVWTIGELGVISSTNLFSVSYSGGGSVISNLAINNDVPIRVVVTVNDSSEYSVYINGDAMPTVHVVGSNEELVVKQEDHLLYVRATVAEFDNILLYNKHVDQDWVTRDFKNNSRCW